MFNFYFQCTILSVLMIAAATLFWIFFQTVAFATIHDVFTAYILVVSLTLFFIYKVPKKLYKLWKI